MLVLVFLYKGTVWLVTMVTHSLASYFIKNGKTHIFWGKFERKHKMGACLGKGTYWQCLYKFDCRELPFQTLQTILKYS